MGAFNTDLQLYSAEFNDREFTAENHMVRALQTESQWLSPATTFLYGSGSQQYSSYNFPMLYMTEGLGNIAKGTSISNTDLSYKWAVLGRPKKTSTVSRSIYTTGDKPGSGFQEFLIPFGDRHFFSGQIIYSPSGFECRIQRDPIPQGNENLYYAVIITSKAETSIPIEDLAIGKRWGQGVRKVSKSRSRGGEHRSYTPYTLNNQLSVVRDTYNIVGNMGNKVMVYEIRADGKMFKAWSQWEMYLSDLALREKLENDLWYSTYNKDADGVIHTIDEDSGEVVPSGAGLLEQIDNVDTYVEMTAKKIETIVNDLVYNASGAQNVTIDIYTGTGGLNEASRAMEGRMTSLGFNHVDTSGVSKPSGPGGKRTYYGFYFDRYVTREGHTINFRHHPMFDRGVMSEIRGDHPIDGRPIESYNMYAIDNSTYDGEQNVQYVTEKGRESIEKVVQGLAAIPFAANSGFAASDIDASSIERMKTQGIVIKRPTNCLKIFNTING